MEITVADFIEKIVNETYQTELQLVPTTEVQGTKLEKHLYEMVSLFGQLMEEGKLAQVTCRAENAGQVTEYSLESGIINLPFADIKKVDNFFDDLETTVEVKVNLIVKDENLNASKFRIDSLLTVAELLADPSQGLQIISDRAMALSQIIQTNLEVAEVTAEV